MNRSRHSLTPRNYVRCISIRVLLCLNSWVVQLHNTLIVSLFDTSAHLAPPTPPPDVPKPPPRKRRRTLPYQGNDGNDTTTLRSDRLKRWTVGLGRRERERVRQLAHLAVPLESRPHHYKDEIAAERGVQLIPERGGACMYDL